ncbi:MAG TPA: glycosyltransferase [Planctomycetota bacterium]|nr:glycosyltransferase [Planctomycetota bacterium]
MRVGLDYWTAATHAPGVGRYVRELVRALARRADAPELALLEVGPGERGVPAEELGLEPAPRGWTRLAANLPRGALTALGGLGLGADRLLGGVDLFHAVDDRLPPLARAPRVLARAEPPRDDARVRRPDALIVFSEAARAPFGEVWGVPPADVHVLPVGCDHWVRAAGVRDDLTGPARVVVLGRTDAARGARVVFEACELLLEGGLALELLWCGRAGDQADDVRRLRWRSRHAARLGWSEDAGERELAQRVREADVLVHLTEREWTPVTPLEGLAAGAALVCSTVPTFVEALGSVPTWVATPPNELRAGDLALALEGSLALGRDPGARAARRAHAAPYTWDRHAALTIDAWTRILGAR